MRLCCEGWLGCTSLCDTVRALFIHSATAMGTCTGESVETSSFQTLVAISNCLEHQGKKARFLYHSLLLPYGDCILLGLHIDNRVNE